MINRVTETIKFNMITNNMFNIQAQYGELMEKLSTQKMINRPSDDPVGTNDILNFRTARTSIEQYQSNITDANIWLQLTTTNISGLRNIVDEAKSMAISESGASASPETRQTSLSTLTALIDEALSLLNAKSGDNYLFGGSATDVHPFTSTNTTASISVSAAQANTYTNTVTSGGTYIPMENKSYVVKIVDGGTLALATYKISTDGGKTWGTTSNPGDFTGGIISNVGGEDIDLTFSAGTFTDNDTFTVNAKAAGYYYGDGGDLNAVIGKNNNLAYNISGAEAFTGQFASGSVINSGTGITNGSIVLTRDATDWHITSQTGHPAMVITSQTADTLTINADGIGADDIKINLTGAWSQNNTINFSTTAGVSSGEIPVTFKGSNSIDLISTLNALKSALQESDQTRAEGLISAQVDNLTNLETQMLQYQTQAGAKMNSLELASSNHDSLKLQITNMLADIENADLTKLITEFQMKQIAMQASYSMASKIGKLTIMDYI